MQAEAWRIPKLVCNPASLGSELDKDLAECAENWNSECIDWKNSKEPYSRYEQEQINLVLSKPWPPHQFVISTVNGWIAKRSPRNANFFGPKFYNHSLAKELYNACGISDRETFTYVQAYV